VIDRVQQYLGGGYSPERIANELLPTDPDMSPRSDLPSARTIRNWITNAYVSVPDQSQPWSLATSLPGEARAVLRVIPAILEVSRGQRAVPSQSEAKWFARVIDAAPDIPATDAFRIGLAYWQNEQADYPNEAVRRLYYSDLDILLAMSPWRDGGEAYVSRWLAQPLRHYALRNLVANARHRVEEALTAGGPLWRPESDSTESSSS
jgi:hypothetical protein